MSEPSARVSATVVNERSANGTTSYAIAFDLLNDIKVDIPGPFGPGTIGEIESDLLDIALSVHFLERDQRKKAFTNRVRQIDARLPVRRPEFWELNRDRIVELLRFMGGCDWSISFVSSSVPVRTAAAVVEAPARSVALNSGGMDSTCGLASLVADVKDIRLASFYTLNSKIQRSLADKLGFESPSRMRAVWKDRSERRGNGALSYRSFLFLTFGAIVAKSFQAGQLLQFENGVMARAVPPAASYFTTRHAHPKTHRLFNELLAAADIDVKVENPFMSMTKGQEVEACRTKLSSKTDDLLKQTDSCWYFHYQRVPVRYGPGTISKEPRRHCGICVPCLVRRAAFGDGNYVFDPMRPPKAATGAQSDQRNFTYNLDALRGFSHIALDTTNGPEFRRALSRNGIDVDQETGSWSDLQQLYSRFAREFLSRFPEK
ncbi:MULTISPECIES: 7-cyano-7-deazaguanine synthase [Mesorhizobium]|uniref:7-cyano-7-deazaguanine synthase n=1 Tax=Mesorhizobium TaxID=68287 RepID=UPI0007ED2532|nr:MULTISPECIES: 7-cyano-7-deazaguanine synthase [Mesorhizobium]PBB52964.1 hypothetical protein CK223_27090 [Mesorhizobium loti]QIA22501.1 hypothetical protein A9K68_012485 [Mesorhizobium sp. AA22]